MHIIMISKNQVIDVVPCLVLRWQHMAKMSAILDPFICIMPTNQTILLVT